MLDRHVHQLAEHFDCVQIMVSSVTEGADGTRSLSRGCGNWHARLNQARTWVLYHDEKDKEQAREDFRKDE